MTQAALAKAIYASESLVAAWETGRRVPKPKYIAPLMEILEIDAILARMIAELLTSIFCGRQGGRTYTRVAAHRTPSTTRGHVRRRPRAPRFGRPVVRSAVAVMVAPLTGS
ncbi:helix-turn-helix transcriptional regulator [Actinoallomurus sp. WRP9H-5]|nr:helix-turn-helix transcriptional regulator [Actinoallomurus rhizosphaericola]MCO5991936.1 helix-turn-helix transcriptional regulator [Actinoallomurus rhizosphaericola]